MSERILFSNHVCTEMLAGRFIESKWHGTYGTEGYTNPDYPDTEKLNSRPLADSDWYLSYEKHWFRMRPRLYRENTYIPLDKPEVRKLLALRAELRDIKKNKDEDADREYRDRQHRLRWWP